MNFTSFSRNKGIYGTFGLYPSRVLGRFLINSISLVVILHFSSKEALHVKVCLDLNGIKTNIKKTKRRSGVYR